MYPTRHDWQWQGDSTVKTGVEKQQVAPPEALRAPLPQALRAPSRGPEGPALI